MGIIQFKIDKYFFTELIPSIQVKLSIYIKKIVCDINIK